MMPSLDEIREVQQALEILQDYDYTEDQLEELTDILEEHALEIDERTINDLFEDLPSVRSALTNLHKFAITYIDEEDLMDEFHVELEVLIDSINPENGSGISV